MRHRLASEPAAPRIAVRLALTGEDAREVLADARALEAANVDALWVDAADADPYVMLAAIAAVTWRCALVAAGAPDATGRATCERLAHGRLVIAEDAARAGERWIQSAFPASKSAWREARAAAAASEATGIVLPNDERLIDLLRNPDVDDDRSDLNIAVG